MKTFKEWDDDRKNKLVAVRRWLWNQQYTDKKDVQPPVSENDPDYEWIKKQLYKLGPLDPHTPD